MTTKNNDEFIEMFGKHQIGLLDRLSKSWKIELQHAEAAIPQKRKRIDRAVRSARIIQLIKEFIDHGYYEAAVFAAFSGSEAGFVIPFEGPLERSIHVDQDNERFFESLGMPIKNGDFLKFDFSAMLPPEGKTDRARRKTGIDRAASKHGDRKEESRKWQSRMDTICETPGMSRSKAWLELEAETGSKRETLERYGVKCPIEARRGPKKLPPRT